MKKREKRKKKEEGGRERKEEAEQKGRGRASLLVVLDEPGGLDELNGLVHHMNSQQQAVSRLHHPCESHEEE